MRPIRKPLVAGNWKMNGDRASIASLLEEMLEELDAAKCHHCEVLVFPTHVYLSEVVSRLTDHAVASGAQDVVDSRSEGAFTGAVSASMVRDIGCTHALVGHSERRTVFGEDDHTVAEKYARCVEAGLTPILCVGETLAEREAEQTLDVVIRQLQAVVERVGMAGIGAPAAMQPVGNFKSRLEAFRAQSGPTFSPVSSPMGQRSSRRSWT
ncbi:MAG: triose-phosphate isomerase family protein, partial [Pseudomonadales bacterium]